MTLFFQEYGTGHPLIILHGLLGSLDNWHTLSTSFGKRFRVIAVDQRNHGRSPHSDEMTYKAMAADLVELLDRLALSSAFVLGHSMGGKTAMQLALDFPDRVDKLIVVDIAPRAYPHLHDVIFEALNSVDLSQMESRQQVDDALASRAPDTAVRQFLLKNHTQRLGGIQMEDQCACAAKQLPGNCQSDRICQPISQTGALCAKLARSSYVLESDTADIHRIFPKATIESVDAGHWIHAEAPERFSELVLDFLASSRSGD